MDTLLINFIIFGLPFLLLVGAWLQLFFAFRREKKNAQKIDNLSNTIIKQNDEVIGALKDIKNTIENRKP
jgi:hypothetical protein